MATSEATITHLLVRLQQGDRAAEAPLVELVYPELHRLASFYWSRERRGHTLQPTELVAEAYMLLAGQWRKGWQNRAHFFGVAAQVMRRVLVDHARSHGAAKRGGGDCRTLSLDSMSSLSPAHVDSLLVMDQALTRLAQWDHRQSQVVELRFFGGLTEEETALVLGVNRRTVQRDWEMARAWLLHEMSHSHVAEPT